MPRPLSRRAMLKFMGAGVGLAALSGCVAPSASTSPGSEAGADAASAVDLVWWTAPLYPGGVDGSEQDAAAEVFPRYLADQYQEENPGVTIAIEVIPFADGGVQKVVAAKASGTQPNAVYMDASYEQFANNWFIAINDYITEEDRADIYDWAWEMQGYQGNIYGWPWFIDPVAWPILNLKIFEEADAMDLVPQDPDRSWTWDQFLEAVKATTIARSDGTQVFGTGLTGVEGGYFYWPMLENFGATMWDDSGKWTADSPEAAEGFQFLLDLQEVHNVLAPGVAGMKLSTLSTDFFLGGRMALINWFGGMIGSIRRGIDDGTITVPMEGYVVKPPTLPDATPVMFTASKTHYAMTPEDMNGDVIAESVAFTKYLVNAENSRVASRIGLRSVRRSGADWYQDVGDPNEDFMDKAIGEMTMRLWATPTPSYNWSVMHQEWLSNTQAVFNLEKTPEQALSDVTNRLNGLAGL